MGDKVTVGDIARRLGVSKATVSYALNDQPGVGAATRDRVKQLAQELGWYPSFSARSLSLSRTDVVGVVLARTTELLGTEPYYMRTIAGMESVFGAAGVDLLLRIVGSDHDAEIGTYRKWVGGRRVDGVVMFDQVDDDPRLELVRQLELPAVMQGIPVDGSSVGWVSSDDEADARQVIEALRALGHREVVQVTGPQRFVHERERSEAMRMSAEAAGIRLEQVESDYSSEGGASVAAQLMAREERPTALAFDNDLMSVGALAALLRAGVSVPGEVSVISWDDSLLCQVGDIALTALGRDPAVYGQRCAQMLLGLIAGEAPARVLAPPSRLIVRATTGPARRG